jgi:TolB protein
MLTHAEAQQLLHAGRQALSAAELLRLETHVEVCAECRAYSVYLAAAEPRLAEVLRARWPFAAPAPTGDYVRRVQARAGLPQSFVTRPLVRRLGGWPLAGAAALLVLAILWISSLGGATRTSGPAQTESPTAAATVTLPPVTFNPIAALSSPGAATSQPVAPGAGLIAFLSRQADGADELYVMRPDGSGLRNLSNHPAHDKAPAWSPDGTRLAFVSDRTGRPEVFTVRPDGTGLTQITETSAPTADYDYVFAWAPDGSTRLALALVPHDTTGEWSGGLYMILETAAPQPVPGEGARQLAKQASDVRWAPVGNLIAYAAIDEGGAPALFAIVAPGTTSFELVHWRTARLTPLPAPDEFNLYPGFDWSPDSTRLIYLELGPWRGAPSDSALAPGAAARIVSIDAGSAVGGGEFDMRPATLLEIQPAPNGIRGLRWSPDGANLLYLQDARRDGCFDPYLLPAAGGPPIHLQDVCYVVRTALPAFSADGRYLLLSARWGSSLHGAGIGLIDVSAALDSPRAVPFVPLIDQSSLDHSPAWQPGYPVTPVCNLLHTVVAGETILDVALQYGLPFADLGPVNGLDENYTLNLWQPLIIPQACSTSLAQPPASLLGGKLLAYAATVGDNWDIFVTDGDTETRLTTDPGDDLAPAWSPDGTRLAFLSVQDGVTGLYVMQANGSGQTLLSPNAWRNGPPQWLPDGQQLSFITTEGDARFDWRLINADGTGERTMRKFLTWPPELHWAPDGERIAFLSYADQVGPIRDAGEIYTMQADGTNPIRLTGNAWHDRYPVWSPDGRRIAYFFDPANDYGLWVMNADGTGQHRVAETEYVQPVAWSPDSQRLVYAAGRHLYIVTAYGTGLTQLPVPAGHELVQSPAWQP